MKALNHPSPANKPRYHQFTSGHFLPLGVCGTEGGCVCVCVYVCTLHFGCTVKHFVNAATANCVRFAFVFSFSSIFGYFHPHFSSSYPARLFIATLIKIQMGAYATLCVLLIFTLYPNEIECGQSCCMMGSPTTLATPYLMLLPVSVCVSFALRQTESLLHILADNTRCCILPNIKDNFPKYIFEVRSN